MHDVSLALYQAHDIFGDPNTRVHLTLYLVPRWYSGSSPTLLQTVHYCSGNVARCSIALLTFAINLGIALLS